MSDAGEFDNIEALEKVKMYLPFMFKNFKVGEFITKLAAFDRGIFNVYFKGFRINKVNRSRLREICSREIFEKKNEKVAMFVNMYWNQEHKKLYNAIYDEVKKINENVEEIEQIEDEKADEILKYLEEKKFSYTEILISVLLNDVKFSSEFIQNRIKVKIESETTDDK